MNEVITLDDLNCLLSAIKSMEEEGFSEQFLEPKKRLAGKLARMISDTDFEKIRTPKWLKKERVSLAEKREVGK
ncbi:hypothetical protein KKH13_05065 [Patescibacteria group bacterium]|nr:hypothetical protein [Patescibacteria group bacterium]